VPPEADAVVTVEASGLKVAAKQVEWRAGHGQFPLGGVVAELGDDGRLC
jgi:hypothetical protein